MGVVAPGEKNIPYLCPESGPMPNYKGRRIAKNNTNSPDQCKARSKMEKQTK